MNSTEIVEYLENHPEIIEDLVDGNSVDLEELGLESYKRVQYTASDSEGNEVAVVKLGAIFIEITADSDSFGGDYYNCDFREVTPTVRTIVTYD